MVSTSRHNAVARHIPPAEASLEDVAAVAKQAAHYASAGQYDAALACYREVLLLDDTRPELWFNYASLQRAMGLAIDAVESFEFALRIRPDLYAARFCLAKLLFEMGQPLAAKAHYEQIVEQNPGYVPAWRNLGQLLFALGDLWGARRAMQEAIQRAPNDADLKPLLEGIERASQERGAGF
jgi:tetratricopeptide (TPR) repeat protein